MACLNSLCPPNLFFPVLEKGRVSSPPSRVHFKTAADSSTELEKSQIWQQRIFVVHTSKPWPFPAHVTSCGQSKKHISLFPISLIHGVNSSRLAFCCFSTMLTLASQHALWVYHLTALLISLAVKTETLQRKFCWPTGTTPLTAAPIVGITTSSPFCSGQQ